MRAQCPPWVVGSMRVQQAQGRVVGGVAVVVTEVAPSGV